MHAVLTPDSYRFAFEYASDLLDHHSVVGDDADPDDAEGGAVVLSGASRVVVANRLAEYTDEVTAGAQTFTDLENA